jgi:hypothetical protein
MRHKIGDLVYHPNISPKGSLGQIVEIRYSSSPSEAVWFGDELQFFVEWHGRQNENALSYADEDITIMKRWLHKRILEDAT